MMDANAEIELELTFLAKAIPKELNKTKPVAMVDIYVPADSDFPVLRLRKKGDQYEITKKVPLNQGDYSSHTEHTIQLNPEEYDALSKASNRTVIKDRYTLHINDQPAEIDIFGGKLAGLVLIDFEFGSAEAKASFTPPSYCLADVTQRRFILGGQLAGKSYDDINADLKRYNYQPLSI